MWYEQYNSNGPISKRLLVFKFIKNLEREWKEELKSRGIHEKEFNSYVCQM